MPSIQDRFAEADALYQVRESNPAGIADAHSAYLAILNDPGTERGGKIRAASQLGRLSIYLGEMLTPKSDTATRYKIFSDCWNGFIEKINPTLVGENPAYYYFKGVSLAYWCDVAAPSEYIFQVTTLLQMIEKGALPANKDFEGGGPYRLAAFVRGNNRLAWVPVPGMKLYSPQDALTVIRWALDSPGMADLTTGDTVSGQEFYENWLAAGVVYTELNDTTNARKSYQDGISQIRGDIDVGAAPASRTFESEWVLGAAVMQLDALG